MKKLLGTIVIIAWLPAVTRADSEIAKLAIARAKESVDIFCQKLDLACTGFERFEIAFTEDPLGSHGHYSGLIQYNEKKILVSLKSSDIEATAFHELIHWVRYSHLKSKGYSTGANVPEYQWIIEAIPFMAEQLLGFRAAGLADAEMAFFNQKLSGSLLKFDGGTMDYGLVGLWSRYLMTHLSEKKEFLKFLINFNPLEAADIGSISLKPFWLRNPPPDSALTFSNLYNYFALALTLNTSVIGSWRLYSLDLPSGLLSRQSPLVSRTRVLKRDQCVSLDPLEFFYASPEILDSPVRVTRTGASREILLRGMEAPLMLSEQSQWSVSAKSWHRILFYNPTRQPLEICFK